MSVVGQQTLDSQALFAMQASPVSALHELSPAITQRPSQQVFEAQAAPDVHICPLPSLQAVALQVFIASPQQ